MNKNYKCSKCGSIIQTNTLYCYINVEGNSASTPLLCSKCAMLQVIANKEVFTIDRIPIKLEDLQ